MTIAFTTNWWALVIRGVAAIIFGILTFVWPGITITALVLVFGAYAIVDGIFAIMAGVRAPKSLSRWWLLLIEGIVSVAAGVVAFLMPGITALFLLVMIASWAIVTGVIEIIAAIQLRSEITGEWLMVLSGVASIVFGGLLLYDPGAGALTVVWIIGAYAIFFGILLVALGFKLRSVDHSFHGATPHPA
jgi:uncharacterized membrane protein HdeD (DUF308 family)